MAFAAIILSQRALNPPLARYKPDQLPHKLGPDQLRLRPLSSTRVGVELKPRNAVLKNSWSIKAAIQTADQTDASIKVAEEQLTGSSTGGNLLPENASWYSVRQERWESAMVVEGEIPTWLNGTYLRNGPGMFHIGDRDFKHLFDGYSTLVRLSFANGHLTAGHAQLQSHAYQLAKKHEKPCFREFAEVPKHENVLSLMGELAGMAMGTTLTDNANTGVVKLGDGRVVCFTETIKGSIEINPDTLETLGRFEYDDRLGGLIHSPHPYINDEELITLLPDLLNPGYTVVRMLAGTNKRKAFGRVKCKGPAPGWVHSFIVTENYIIVPEMPLRYSAMNLLKSEPCPYFKFDWLPETKAFMHVVSRHTGELITTAEVPPFVTFHFINGYEERSENGSGPLQLVADCCEHMANPTILRGMQLEQLRSIPRDVLPDARVGRFIIPLDGSGKGRLESAVPPVAHGRGLDMSTINPLYTSKKHRYIYACGAHRPAHFPNCLTKIDVDNQVAANWYEDGCIPTEPFFVPRPGATAEDDGVVLSIVSDSKGDGFILIMDGASFEEIARAQLPYGLPYGLHGCWVPREGGASTTTNATPTKFSL